MTECGNDEVIVTITCGYCHDKESICRFLDGDWHDLSSESDFKSKHEHLGYIHAVHDEQMKVDPCWGKWDERDFWNFPHILFRYQIEKPDGTILESTDQP